MPYPLRIIGLCFMLFATAVLPSACRSTAPEQTATAVHEMSRGDYEELVSTATVARARMQTTLDYLSTRVRQAEESGEFLRFNLANLGTDANFIEEAIALFATLPAGATATSFPAERITGATPVIAPTAAARTIVTPYVPSPAASEPVAESGPRLSDLVMASGVNADDCPIDTNPTFTTQSQEIYVVARVFDIPANASISSSWQRDGTEVALIGFSNARYIDGTCIWLYIDQTVTPFLAGSWSVEVRIDESPAASPLAFQIVEA